MMAAWTLWILLMCIVLTGQGSKAQDCGIAPLNTRITGGVNATAGSWPWMVSLHINFAALHICGGTLISDQWVLTAAHCIILNFPTVWILYFGRETQSGPNVREVNRTISEIIIHPNYNQEPFNNDIALMKLSSPITFNDYIRPVCLASNFSEFHNSTPCWATGWGSRNRTAPPFDALQEVRVPVIGTNQCSCNYRSDVNITDQMICAGEENKGICLGDGGGPLQCKQNTRWILAGVTNFGRLCAPANFPEVYARVSEFQDWIMEQVAGSNVSFVTFTSMGTDPDDSFVCPTLNATTAAPNATTAAPNATTAAPNATATAAPNATTAAPNATTTAAPNATATAAPNATATAAPNATTTAAPNATATAAPNMTATAAPNMTATVVPPLISTGPPTTSSTPSTVATDLGLIVILVTVFLQHIAAP